MRLVKIFSFTAVFTIYGVSIFAGTRVWDFNDVPHNKELRSFPYHIHKKDETEATLIRSIDEALSYIEKTL